MTIEAFDSDLSAVGETDALLDAIAAGEPPADDPIALALGAWLTELGGSPIVTPAIAPHGRSGRRHARRTAVGAAVVGLLIAGAGTAAALPGTPLHRALFGTGREAGRPSERPTGQDDADANGRSAVPVPLTSTLPEEQPTAHHESRPDPTRSSVTVSWPGGNEAAPNASGTAQESASDATAPQPWTSPKAPEPEDSAASATSDKASTASERASNPEPTTSGSQDGGSSGAESSSEGPATPVASASDGSG